ncbi:MAG: cell division protein ZapA [Amoebophilaceae bacterium]|nr:cell division protein ZapA [Amoebophilaceae bacterium]
MEMLSIKIKISDRVYPMKVKPADESFVRQAAVLLAERIKDYQTNLRIQDQQDLLSMVAFDCLVEVLKIEQMGNVQWKELMANIVGWGNQIEAVKQQSLKANSN